MYNNQMSQSHWDDSPTWKDTKYPILSYDVASGSDITPCIKIDKPVVIYRFLGNVMQWRF